MTTLNRPGGTTIYFREESTAIQYSYDRTTWTGLSLFPCTITNTSPSATSILSVEFTTNVTFTDGLMYFVCGSSHIRFGNTSLNDDGSRPVIIIDDVLNYAGLIQNGTGLGGGHNNIYVYNIIVSALNESTLAADGGWIGQQYFGKVGTENYIVNCSSDGPISVRGGGIVGSASGGSLVNQPGELFIRGCSSSGPIGMYGGGIAGNYAGEGNNITSGSVTCEYCWSEGTIGEEAGGIFGSYSGVNYGSAVAIQCYSTNIIGVYGGGIFGSYAGESIGQAQAQKCYSRGSIQADGGGIFGFRAGFNFGATSAFNCYSLGAVATPGTGIYGSSKSNGTETNCYAADGSWNSTAANTSLQGVPTSSISAGTTWISTGLNQPYELNGMGYTPYTTLIVNESSELVQTFTQTVRQGQITLAAVISDASGNEFIILKIQDGNPEAYSTITINSQRGSIHTSSNTSPGTYLLTIRSVGSYHVTQFYLTVTQTPSESVTCCEKPLRISNEIDYSMRADLIAGNILISNTRVRRGPISYSDLMRMKQAYAAKQ